MGPKDADRMTNSVVCVVLIPQFFISDLFVEIKIC